MKWFRFAGLAATAAAACLALTACGGSSGSTAATGAAATASASPGATSSSSLAAFQSCLKSHGVKIQPGAFASRGAHPFPTGSPHAFPSGSPRPRPTGSFTGRPGGFAGADSTALKDCAKYAPSGFGSGGSGGGFRGVSASALAAFKSCMSQNGVKVTGTTAQQILSSLRKATGKTATADKTCRVLLQPSGGAPSPSPSS
jgi:hypothetical protein